MDIETLQRRVDALLAIEESTAMSTQTELYNGALGVLQSLYGRDSSQERDLRGVVESIGAKAPQEGFRVMRAIEAIRGVLRSIRGELDSGFAGSIRSSISAEVLSDFVKLARATLDESGDEAKNVACVLAAAAFEDTLRRLAELRGISPRDKLADVVTSLKEAGALKGAQVGIAQSFLSFRNRALHAQWLEIDRASAHSALAFTEHVLLSEFER